MNGDGSTDGWSARRDRVVSAALARLRRFPRDDPAWAQARDEAINAAIPLARRLARRFSFRGEELDDLTQVALLGLIKSVDRFDVAQGVRFERFAAPTMLGELRRHFRDRGWTLRVHRRLQELHLEINRSIPQLCQRLQRTPQVGDLADHLHRDPDEIRAGMACASAYAVGSLNSMVSTGGSLAELGELLGAADARLESLADQHVVRQAVAALPQRDRHLLALRFTADLTQAEIAQRLGLSQMHVSRLLNRCFVQLRESLGDQA
ncbi:SigB/SigF/SigG family RNA polymerase sigma factor [Catellatospora sp. TT07R-123]|uniref:SigB/SigF/SigG family RNA polymerase sigma factor n=1 Tax=Catellatospora sp. TT07R-123 TaxID=2733863 RepID=UPI001FD50B4E|nr:SigB/SigF/SigG family RNA polymerase sigma factor [Catellatospora sp. TT07R-123]